MSFIPRLTPASLIAVSTTLVASATTLFYYKSSDPMASVSLSAIRASNAAFSASYLPVAVFVGGTSGIGQGMAEGFARHTKGNAHIIIMGRNKSAAEAIISTFPKPTDPRATHEFVPVDAMLMKSVKEASSSILENILSKSDGRLNFLVMSQGISSTLGRTETVEGIDRKLAVHYYSRWTFINELTPALLKAKQEGEDAKVISVFSAGTGGKVDTEDLGLKKTYSLRNAAVQTPTYNDLMIESFAAKHPKLTFIHAYPGIVRTNLQNVSDSRTTRILGPVLLALLRPFSRSQEECGEYLLSGLYRSGRGASRISWDGSDLAGRNYYGTDEAKEKLWAHTIEATKSS